MTGTTTQSASDDSPFRCNRPTIEAPNLLLVEGADEYHFFRFLRPRDDVQIHVYGGKDQLKSTLKLLVGIEGYDRLKRVAIVRDADDDPKAALQSALGQWKSGLGEQSALKVTSDVWFKDSQEREWTVWIMPDPNSRGDLEELLWRVVKTDEHRKCVEELITCLDGCDPVPFSSRTKATLYSWLATQKDPVKELHAAFKSSRELFNSNDPVFSRFLGLIEEM